MRWGAELGFRTVLVEPTRLAVDGHAGPDGRTASPSSTTSWPTATPDVVVTDHHRDELGELLRDALARPARWIGVMGNPRHEGPHVAALTALGVPAEEIARVHRPIGLDIGSQHARRDRASPRWPACSPTGTAAPAASRTAADRPVSDVLLGADLGTSGLKLVALDDSGTVVAEAEPGYAVDRPAPDRAETDVGAWRQAFDEALAAVARGAGRRAACGRWASPGRCTAPVLVDAGGTALRPALLWPDHRAAAELDLWRRAAGGRPRSAGQPAGARDDRADAGLAGAGTSRGRVARAAAVLLPKDALRAALLPGADPAVTDRSDASATLLWDVVGRRLVRGRGRRGGR